MIRYERLTTKQSSLVLDIYVSDKGSTCRVNLKNDWYEYRGISRSTCESWAKFHSLGTFYNRFILNKYKYINSSKPSSDQIYTEEQDKQDRLDKQENIINKIDKPVPQFKPLPKNTIKNLFPYRSNLPEDIRGNN